VRAKIGGFSGHGPPDPEPTDIKVLRHWKAIAIQCKRGEPIFDNPKSEKRRIMSREFHLRCKKNKTFEPERVSSFIYNFRGEHRGVDHADEVLRLGKVWGLLETKGSWIEGYGIRAQSEEKFKAKLLAEPTVIAELMTDILEASTS
jgi:hypothetical protein